MLLGCSVRLLPLRLCICCMRCLDADTDRKFHTRKTMLEPLPAAAAMHGNMAASGLQERALCMPAHACTHEANESTRMKPSTDARASCVLCVIVCRALCVRSLQRLGCCSCCCAFVRLWVQAALRSADPRQATRHPGPEEVEAAQAAKHVQHLAAQEQAREQLQGELEGGWWWWAGGGVGGEWCA